jgi:dienelactone hydrolase
LPSIITRIAIAIAGLTIGQAKPLFAAALEIPFTLSKPAGDGPFPAVVILHDCSGLGPRSSAAPWRWSTRLVAKGYVTIWPDSFSSRGYPNGICMVGSRRSVSYRKRASDAYAALSYLRSLPYVDAHRIAVMGGSHGGSSTLATIVDRGNQIGPENEGFAAAIALYPQLHRQVRRLVRDP